MRCDLPAPRRCCFCIPLRIGLLVAGYIKLLLSALYLLYSSVNLYVSLQYVEYDEHYIIVLLILFSLINSIVDVVFHLIFLIGAHKKNYRKIRWYYRYSIYNIIAITIFFFVNMGLYFDLFALFLLFKYVLFVALIYLWALVIQIYLLILVRSEFLKLKGDTKFQFVNNEAESQFSAAINISAEADEVDNNDEMNYDKISV